MSQLLIELPDEVYRRLLSAAASAGQSPEQWAVAKLQANLLAPQQTKGLLQSGAICIAYETVTDARGGLPLLAPMSEVAGRMAVQAAAHHLESPSGGAGLLLGGVPGTPAAKVIAVGQPGK